MPDEGQGAQNTISAEADRDNILFSGPEMIMVPLHWLSTMISVVSDYKALERIKLIITTSEVGGRTFQIAREGSIMCQRTSAQPLI